MPKHESSNLVNDIEERKEKQDEAKDERNEAGDVKESKRKMKNKTDSKASKVSTLQNGLIIEQLKSGESDAKVAVAGKKVRPKTNCCIIYGQIPFHYVQIPLGKSRLFMYRFCSIVLGQIRLQGCP